MSDDRIEELRATLLEFEDDEILEALILNNIVERKNGSLTEWWLHLLDPALVQEVRKASDLQEEEIVLSALAKVLKRRM